MIPGSLSRIGAPILGFVCVAAIAFSWMIFPYFVNGDRVLFETGQQVQVERMGDLRTLNNLLTRYIGFPGGIDVTAQAGHLLEIDAPGQYTCRGRRIIARETPIGNPESGS